MSTLWLIAKPEGGRSDILDKLQGNYAVRAFGSWSSFVTVSSMDESAGPAAVIVQLHGQTIEATEAEAHLKQRFSGALRVFLAQDEGSQLYREVDGFVLPHDIEPLKLVRTLNHLMSLYSQETFSSTYKDLSLDLEDQALGRVGGSSESLTQKEFRLLKLFLKNPGRCIDRSEFIRDVWQGVKVSPRTIDSQVSRLRRRIEGSEVTIESVYGGGYVLR